MTFLEQYEQSHTPGPWTLGGSTDSNPHGDFEVYGAEFGHYCTGRVAIVERRAGVAYLADSCSPQTQRLAAEANARLIAAAPSLLSALQTANYLLGEVLAGRTPDFSDELDSSSWRLAAQEIRQALNSVKPEAHA